MQEDLAGNETISKKRIDFELIPGKILQLNAKIDDMTGNLIAITDAYGDELDYSETIYDVMVDEDQLQQLRDLFAKWNVSFDGTAWTMDSEGDDSFGSLEINWGDINTALKEGRIVLEKDVPTGIWTIDELFNLL
ncbi:MAG: hypothetical protein GW762_01910 [Candidatus Pacebacteria bacterium]|nr:hypothetical protein [Candidatus Paceibacterota bacterium]PIR63437.1 MAG: hypothetical protein COU64_04540 [Candidatus Pacebacteria bacterium CG10_big_fil_rev_8_21_14_0_10_40_26]PIZ79576.1 MAG: hypothetical protein COY01_00445 [Candidatus Pacebacteria bacterium CG_4_10_14_0_2_um_filter_40_20]PJA69029.1 MAG: hypothetical protein CO156_01695 [Candidatus Pacebacteria bacterium CG_4_9_14_3_um_filter_40_12]PJC41838.1 MAG: hypothetical protein CO041_03910 [Candidatus Pacebacteria bacterium CG_4_9_